MADATQQKAATLLQTLDRRYGKPERPVPVPPPSSADAAAVTAVAAKNAQTIAGLVLGLHGAPAEGIESARRLMAHLVDWNEVRVSRPATLIAVLGRQPRALERVALLQRFLEAYFLRQRNLNLDYLYTLKPAEVRRFLGDLEVFDREELAAVLLTGFEMTVFPPGEVLRDMAELTGLLRPKVTALQMAKKFETAFDDQTLYAVYSHLYSLAHDAEGQKLFGKRRSKVTNHNNNKPKAKH